MCKFVNVNIYMCKCVYLNIQEKFYMNVFACIYIYVPICMYMCACIYLLTYVNNHKRV